MKTIALLYNVRRQYPDPKDFRNQVEGDFDDPDTIKWIIKHLKSIGFNVIPIEADEEAYIKLYKNRKKIDFAYNYSEGKHGRDRELQVPTILEILKIPYTGCSPLSQGLILNKAKAKEIFIANNIPTAPFQIFSKTSDMLDRKLKFPLIVKPVAEGSSMGITNNSVVFNLKEF